MMPIPGIWDHEWCLIVALIVFVYAVTLTYSLHLYVSVYSCKTLLSLGMLFGRKKILRAANRTTGRESQVQGHSCH
jgi:hypothetical protein